MHSISSAASVNQIDIPTPDDSYPFFCVEDSLRPTPVVASLSPADIPVGILTCNRAIYLDTTLRSLSATSLPSFVQVAIYDDTSSDDTTKAYLDSNKSISVTHCWPSTSKWQNAGLNILGDTTTITGISDRVVVRRMAMTRMGVSNASCMAISDLFTRHPAAAAAILLQDDVIFQVDWYQKMTFHFQMLNERGIRLGILAGMHLDRGRLAAKRSEGSRAVRRCTAQCYLITRSLYESARDWFARRDLEATGFDARLCRLARRKAFLVHLMAPYVCQHIGVNSEVRPSRKFYETKWQLGRIGTHIEPAYVLASSVRTFAPTTRNGIATV